MRRNIGHITLQRKKYRHAGDRILDPSWRADNYRDTGEDIEDEVIERTQAAHDDWVDAKIDEMKGG